MAVTVFHEFEMRCDCGEVVRVGPSAKFIGEDTGAEWTAYFKPEAQSARAQDVVGTSGGSGDTFACLSCRPFEQLQTTKPKKKHK